MRIIIAPAKKMIMDTDSFAVDDLPQFLEQAEQEGRAIWLTEDLPRSFVLVDSRWGEPVVYISPMSSATLAARAGRGGIE